MKLTLAIETSCDDTSVSILDGVEVISLKTFSQIKDHSKFGGVIPEVASRLHSKNIFKIISESLEDANAKLSEIKRIAVTGGPGFVNTLQVGITVAKTFSYLLKIPLYDINHIEAHAFSPFINKDFKTIPKKAIILIVSGGHTEIFLKNDWTYKRLGKTKDDSIGEAYDKVAKILGYDYPGGLILDQISNLAKEEINAPVSNLKGYDFSYSGLKSYILNKSKQKNISKESLIKGFQSAAIEQLIIKVKKAQKEFRINNVFVGGGVSANSKLREELKKVSDLNIFFPKLKYTSDNAAMIGYLCNIKVNAKKIKPTNISMDAEPRREM